MYTCIYICICDLCLVYIYMYMLTCACHFPAPPYFSLCSKATQPLKPLEIREKGRCASAARLSSRMVLGCKERSSAKQIRPLVVQGDVQEGSYHIVISIIVIIFITIIQLYIYISYLYLHHYHCTHLLLPSLCSSFIVSLEDNAFLWALLHSSPSCLSAESSS